VSGRYAPRTVLPEARIAIDKFHVVRYASDALEAARKELRKTLTDKQRKSLMHDRFALLKRPGNLTDHEYLVLNHWLSYPAMKLAYELKEGFYNIFDNSLSRQEAEQKYDAWLNLITLEIKQYFEPLIRAVENWHEEIFAYFDFLSDPVTNAYTESLNNLIKLINKNGRGYKFDVLRAKILFSDGVRKVSTPKFNRHPTSSGIANMMSMLICETGADYQIRDHGSGIYTLIQKILNGSFFPDQH
jgi:transposase